jgi:NhaP-type Na+/H+ and K+/H+ antiporter
MTTSKHAKYATGFEGKRWIFHGLVWGSIMFIILGIFVPLAEKEAITLKSAALDLALWLVAGLFYGLIMKSYFGWQSKKKAAREEQAGGHS